MRFDVVDRVVWMTIDRPEKRNALSGPMVQNLIEHIEWIDAQPDVAAVVLRGSGGSFSAGGDLDELRVPDAAHVEQYRVRAEQAVVALRALRQPKVAHIDGACFGAGCSLALACDVRISSPASVFGIPALANGLVYEAPFVHRLVETIGAGSAALLLYGGNRWSAAEAATRGLVDECSVDAASIVEAIASNLARADPEAVRANTAAIRGV